jgi:hypothetical protein
MTRVAGVSVLALLLLAPWSARADELTLRDVIELHRSGLGDELLIAVIEADGGPFTLDFTDIHDLKSDGLSERVIAALVRTGKRRSASTAEAPAVSVEQHVTNVVPGLVVVGAATIPHGVDDRDGRHQSERFPRADDGRRDGRRKPYDHKVEVPAATWITRQEDGRNVSPPMPRRHHDTPAATWVTPNPIRTERRADPEGAPRGNEERRPSRPPR